MTEWIPRPVIDWVGTDAPDPRDAYMTHINGHVVGIHSSEESARNHAWALEAYLGMHTIGETTANEIERQRVAVPVLLEEALKAALEVLEDVPYMSNKDDYARLKKTTSLLRQVIESSAKGGMK